MSQVVSMVEAKSHLAELVGQVRFGGKRYILERRDRPMAVLISVEEYEQLKAQADVAVTSHPSPLPAELRRRQEVLVAQAIRLRKRLGQPEDRLGELFADLPPEGDNFWGEVQELG